MKKTYVKPVAAWTGINSFIPAALAAVGVSQTLQGMALIGTLAGAAAVGVGAAVGAMVKSHADSLHFQRENVPSNFAIVKG